MGDGRGAGSPVGGAETSVSGLRSFSGPFPRALSVLSASTGVPVGRGSGPALGKTASASTVVDIPAIASVERFSIDDCVNSHSKGGGVGSPEGGDGGKLVVPVNCDSKDSKGSSMG